MQWFPHRAEGFTGRVPGCFGVLDVINADDVIAQCAALKAWTRSRFRRAR